MPQTDITQLNQWIRERSPSALEALSQIPDANVHDERCLTPLNAAIRYGNDAVFDLLIDQEAVISYVPDMPKDELNLVRRIADELQQSVVEMEEYVAQTLGKEVGAIHWLRSPLLEACRYGNRRAMSALINCGAALNEKDALGLEPVSLCLDVGGEELVGVFLDACLIAGRVVSISDELLQRCFSQSAIFQRLLSEGKLSIKAKRFCFNLACSRLDVAQVQAMLKANHNATTSMYMGYTPLAEAATSHLSFLLQDAQAQSLTAPLQRGMGADINVGSNDLEQMVADIEAWMAEGDDLGEEDVLTLPITAEYPAEINPKPQRSAIIDQRLALIDLLLQHGFEYGVVKGEVDFELVSDLVLINEPRLLEKLLDAGADFHWPSHQDALTYALQMGSFDMVDTLLKHGLKMPTPDSHWQNAYEQYLLWQKEKRVS